MTAVLPGADAQRWGFYASSVSADGRLYVLGIVPESGRTM